MPAPLGRLCLVLHGHLPYVLHHGGWPHGEAWLFEAAAETYLPLIQLLDHLADRERPGVAPIRLTLGLTPVLLEQLASPYFRTAFVDYLSQQRRRAADDQARFDQLGEPDNAALARRWAAFYEQQHGAFQRCRGDLPRCFAAHARAGRVELLTSAATHAYLPLLLNDSSIRAQLSVGLHISERHLGIRPTGLWLPECAYRPAVAGWRPPVFPGGAHAVDSVDRPGLEAAIAPLGLSHFFVDTHLIARAVPIAFQEAGALVSTSAALAYWDTARAWGSPLEPVTLARAEGDSAGLAAFGRHPRVSEQVWSGVIGYPGSGEYLEFHRKHPDSGLRYHRVTSHQTPMADKAAYDPAAVAGKVYEHAQHFCRVIRQLLADHAARTGRAGTIVAPFDAELFGHWWFEGPQFLADVLLTLAHDGSVEVVTPQQVLIDTPPDKLVTLPEGSWGAGGGHDVWLNDQTRWLWETEYRCETRFADLLGRLPWRAGGVVAGHLQRCARELLLLQSSDWPFVIHSQGGVDYAITRFAGHAARFDRIAHIAEQTAASLPLTHVQETELAEADAHDTVFPDLDLTQWLDGK